MAPLREGRGRWMMMMVPAPRVEDRTRVMMMMLLLRGAEDPRAKQLRQGEGASGMPAIQDLVPVIYNQSEYILHLEAEVKFCKEEVRGIKQRVQVVVLENEKLQSSLTKTLMENTALEST
ncbi:hypothetical protein CRUP_009399, partial [Coryphaenoides rupestris]